MQYLNPVDDIEVINLELVIADLEMISKMIENQIKKAKKDKALQPLVELLEKIKTTLENDKPARSIDFTNDEQELLKTINLLTLKKVIYVANVAEDQINSTPPLAEKVKNYAKDHDDEFAIISAKIEEELSQLDKAEKEEYLKELSIATSGLDLISQRSFQLLGLQTYLTTGEKETRAWTIKQGDTAPKAAGVIHTDFERGFIRANIVGYKDFVDNNGLKGAKEKGLLRQEGKDYIMQDGDVVEFLFNV